MDVLILVFLLLMIVGLLSFIILKLFFKNKDAELILNLTFASYLIFAIVIGFYPYINVITALDSISFYYLLGVWAVTMWKVIEGKHDIKKWVISWASIGAAACVIQVIKYSSELLLRNIVDFGVEFLVLFFFITVAGLAKRNRYAGVFSIALALLYAIVAILFSILPPNDPSTILSSLIISVLIAVIPGMIILLLYKKCYSKFDKVKEMLDEI